MADATNNQATPPAASGGLTEDQVKAIIASSLKPITDAQAELSKNLGVIADTLKQLPPATPADKKAETKADQPAGLTEEQVKKLLNDRDADAAKRAAREAKIAELTKSKLGGDADLAKLLTGDTPEALAASAEVIAARLKPATPDTVGGAARGGGTTPTQQPVDLSKLSPTQLIARGLNERTKAPAA